MADIVNLNKARKQRARAERKKQAAENRTRFGRGKADRRLEAAREKKAARDLSSHRLSGDENGRE